MAVFNKYGQMPFVPYRLMEYLAKNNENIWKILKYDTYDCLSEPNLSFEDKMKLVWSHEADQEDYRIFFTQLVEDMIPDSTTLMKIYKYSTVPRSHIEGVATYEFDILYGGKISLIEFDGVPCNRGDVMEHELLKTLNGTDVGQVGALQFNTKLTASSRSGLNLGNSQTFTGTSLVFGVLMLDIGEGGTQCD